MFGSSGLPSSSTEPVVGLPTPQSRRRSGTEEPGVRERAVSSGGPVEKGFDAVARGEGEGAAAVDDKDSRFERQLEDLFRKHRAQSSGVVFSKESLASVRSSGRSFSCGGTRTVKLNSARGIARDHPALEAILPPADPLSSLNLSCAVVGNSGALLETQFGESIDRADAVIRFNAAVTEGYEQFVGARTTYRILNRPEPRLRYEGYSHKNETTLTMLRDNGDVRAWIREVRDLDRGPSSLAESYFFDFEFLCLAWRLVHKKGVRPSSGLVGIVLALHLCRRGEVDVYGFNSANYFSPSSRPHYYDWERPAKGRERVHPFDTERRFYRALQRSGYVRLH